MLSIEDDRLRSFLRSRHCTVSPLAPDPYDSTNSHHQRADHEVLCDWVAADHLGGHDWCPTAVEPGDEYTLVLPLDPPGNYDNDRVVGCSCIGCGYHPFGTPELEPGPTPTVWPFVTTDPGRGMAGPV